MTKDKAEKRATRARMTKTGERYTTARLYALDLHRSAQDEHAPIALQEQPSLELELEADLASLAGGSVETPPAAAPALPPRVAEPAVGDAAVQRATGKMWDEWLVILDAWDGTMKPHAEIARYVHEAYGIDGWWAQNVTVGYERARGMRAVHERPDGFSANASKTFPVPVERLFAAIAEDDERARWLKDIELRRRTSQPNKSARFDILPGDMRLSANFIAKGPDKSSVQLQQERLPEAADVERWKAVWKEQFAHLADYLSQETAEP